LHPLQESHPNVRTSQRLVVPATGDVHTTNEVADAVEDLEQGNNGFGGPDVGDTQGVAVTIVEDTHTTDDDVGCTVESEEGSNGSGGDDASQNRIDEQYKV
jgi:hypothetical protein